MVRRPPDLMARVNAEMVENHWWANEWSLGLREGSRKGYFTLWAYFTITIYCDNADTCYVIMDKCWTVLIILSEQNTYSTHYWIHRHFHNSTEGRLTRTCKLQVWTFIELTHEQLLCVKLFHSKKIRKRTKNINFVKILTWAHLQHKSILIIF